jgi:hypothetical protein
MPMVTVKVIEGVFTQEQKQEMIRRITDTMVEIEGENLRRSPGSSSRRCTAVTGGRCATASPRPMCTLYRRSQLRRAEPRGR